MWLAKKLMAGQSTEEMKSVLVKGGVLLMLIIFTGLMVMLYLQDYVRKKHEATEREKIRAVEGSLAKSQFLFNMSHDIRTPMNAIVGYTQLALKEPLTPDLHDYLTKIDLSSQHLLALINDVLEMSRIENGKVDLEYVPTDLCAVFEGMRDLFAEQMKQKDMEFSVHTSQVKNRYVWCDRKNLNRVLLNILGNAYKFTPVGGKISATLWEIGTGEDGYGSYEMRIQDNGIGMSQKFAEKMFNAFERERSSTDSGIEGTGLGLSITKSIVDMMGGTIEVLTAPGTGTEMIIRLKFRLAKSSDISDAPQTTDEEESTDFTGKRLLLVEDNMINMEIANMILEQMGFEVETFFNFDMIKSFGVFGHYSRTLREWQKKYKEHNLDYNKFEIKSRIMLTLVSTVVSMAAFGYCLYRLWNGQILYGDMTFFLQQRGSLSGRFNSLIGTIPGMLNSAVSAHRIRELVDLPREEHDAQSPAGFHGRFL